MRAAFVELTPERILRNNVYVCVLDRSCQQQTSKAKHACRQHKSQMPMSWDYYSFHSISVGGMNRAHDFRGADGMNERQSHIQRVGNIIICNKYILFVRISDYYV